MRLILVLALIVAAATALSTPNKSLDDRWEAFKSKFEKKYADADEENLRRLIWETKLDTIEKHNAEADQGLHKFRMGENQFADLTIDEFRSTMNGYRRSSVDHKKKNGVSFASIQSSLTADVPDSIDWRDYGAVTEVKNQKECGSCWSFSTTGAIEGAHFLSTNELVSLSEQNLLDCSDCHYLNFACDGGDMVRAYDYVINNGGIDTEDSYPYQSWAAYLRRDTCLYTDDNRGATISSYVYLTVGDEDAMKTAAGTVGPLSIGMDASLETFSLYSSGIYDDTECSSVNLDHGVLIVGYGEDDGTEYWLVKNSWGVFWGEDGYFRIARNADDLCGIAQEATYPIV